MYLYMSIYEIFKLIINLMMQNGKKALAYKQFFNMVFFLKKNCNINSLLLIKKVLSKKRI